jgi:DNA-binding transcriptional LysR family regulator
MTKGLSLEGLRYAMTVAQTGSFSEAARFHGVSQPALSTAIARLEATLGDRLFDRSTRGATSTAFGSRIIPLVELVLRDADAVTAEARRLTSPAREIIHLGVSPLISPRLVAAAFGAVRSIPPTGSCELVLREANMDVLLAELQTAELDLILIPSVGPIPLHEHRVVDSEPVVVVEAEPAGPGTVELASLVDHQFILVPDGCGLTRFTHQLFEAHERALRIYAGEANSYQVLEEWARLGIGSALLPESKLAVTGKGSRRLLDDGQEVAIFYEAVWNPRSSLATDLAGLTEAISTQR